ncbi:glycosyltransferase [Dorea sp. YH-dor228]|uniref:glycosyltransferase n=1 Tax=Dorea sp. YH-dor228 TaxID=3151120 RepID=UPI0032422BB9
MIKILFIHSQLVCGGAEQALFDLVTQMDKTKYKITVLVQFEGGVWEQRFRDAGIDIHSPWSFQKQSQNPFVKLHNLYKRIRVKKAMDHNGEDLLTICLNENFDIIVSYGLWFMQQMCFAGEAKTVKFIHGDMETDPKFCKNIMETLPLIQRFDRIICVSERARKSFCEITGITNNVSVHFNPLNSNNIRIRSYDKVLLPNDLPLICAVGRLVEEKGFARLICIHKRLVEDGVSHRLIIVGDGREKERLTSLIQEIHAEDSVIMVGYQRNPYPYIAHSKFLICSSYTEGMGIVAMEALLLGIPVVSSAPSVGELFGEEFCGIITGRDDQSLEEGIRCMLENPAIYEKAKLGAERRGSFFDGQRMTREIEEEFFKLMAE